MTTLITPTALAERLSRGDRIVVLDVQYNLVGTPGRELYAVAHLPGARFVDLDTELAGPPGAGGRHPLPDVAALERALRANGIDDSSAVAVYDQGTGLGSARAWWLLTYVGLSGVQVLDGGLAAWVAAGLPVSDGVAATATPGTVTVRPGALPLLDAEGAAELARTGLLLDARADERYAGRTEPIDAVAGHIPGARNAPMSDYVDQDGRLLPREELMAYFAGRGVFEHAEVGAYCGSGITAAHLALALRQLGITAPVYVGSWSEWISDPTRPIATGDDPT
ncbi:MAG: sulfurtransferase [Dermatophilaceae bacterium]